ncbi:MAG: hypothetical protein LDL53_11060 [Candidatus Hydrogenedens sp.]|nr:hypothetical protein [Candidatus Hydrogenedens sp.]
MFTLKRYSMFVTILVCVSFCFLLMGCPSGGMKPPKKSTALEIGGDYVTATLKLWETQWYSFTISGDNTPYVLILKDGPNPAMGIQVDIFYQNNENLEWVESEDLSSYNLKARDTLVAEKAGTYYIRVYGYTILGTDKNKDIVQNYVIGLAKPETYDSASELSVGGERTFSAIGDVYNIFKLTGLDSKKIYKITIESAIDDSKIVMGAKPYPNVRFRIDVYDKDEKEYITAREFDTSPIYLTRPNVEKYDFYLVVWGNDELTSQKVKVKLEVEEED